MRTNQRNKKQKEILEYVVTREYRNMNNMSQFFAHFCERKLEIVLKGLDSIILSEESEKNSNSPTILDLKNIFGEIVNGEGLDIENGVEKFLLRIILGIDKVTISLKQKGSEIDCIFAKRGIQRIYPNMFDNEIIMNFENDQGKEKHFRRELVCKLGDQRKVKQIRFKFERCEDDRIRNFGSLRRRNGHNRSFLSKSTVKTKKLKIMSFKKDFEMVRSFLRPRSKRESKWGKIKDDNKEPHRTMNLTQNPFPLFKQKITNIKSLLSEMCKSKYFQSQMITKHWIEFFDFIRSILSRKKCLALKHISKRNFTFCLTDSENIVYINLEMQKIIKREILKTSEVLDPLFLLRECRFVLKCKMEEIRIDNKDYIFLRNLSKQRELLNWGMGVCKFSLFVEFQSCDVIGAFWQPNFRIFQTSKIKKRELFRVLPDEFKQFLFNQVFSKLLESEEYHGVINLENCQQMRLKDCVDNVNSRTHLFDVEELMFLKTDHLMKLVKNVSEEFKTAEYADKIIGLRKKWTKVFSDLTGQI